MRDLTLASPHAVPDPFAMVIMAATILALLSARIGAFRLMIAGAILGVLRSRLPAIFGFKAMGRLIVSSHT